jgi:hypothetical protein
MAVTFNGLTSGVAGIAATPATASVAPTANAVVLVSFTYHTIGTVADPASVTGAGLTFTKLAGGQFFNVGVGNYLYYALAASPGVGAITVTATNLDATPDLWTWQVGEFPGVDTSGTNGAGALQDFATTASTSTTVSTTMGTSADATYAVCYAHTNGATITPGRGFTKSGDADDTANCQTAVEYRLTGVTTADFSCSVSATLGIMAVAIKAPSVAPVAVGAGGTGIYRLARRPWR